MSGIFSIVVASFGSAASPVGLLAAISNPNGNAVDSFNLAIRSDQLNASVQTSAASVTQLTVLSLPLALSSITWQTALTDAADLQKAAAIQIDSAGNPVVAGSKYVTANGFYTGYVAKFNSSGVIQWQRRINNNSDFFGLTLDSSDNVYCAGAARFFSSSLTDIYVAKLNSSGTLQFRRNIGNTSTPFESATSISINNVDYFNVVGQTNSPGNTDSAFIILNRSTGATVGATTQRDSGGSGIQEGKALIRGEGDTVSYCLVRSYATLSPGSNSNQVLLRHTNAGGFVWQSQLSDSQTLDPVGLIMDPSGTHVYTCATALSSDGLRNELLLAKYVSSTGSLVWQRKLACPTASLVAKSIATDSLDNVYITLDQTLAAVSNRGLVLKVPGSGAGAGNSAVLEGSTYTYSVSTVTSSSGALVIAAYSPTNSEFSETTVTPTATSAANTLAIASQTL